MQVSYILYSHLMTSFSFTDFMMLNCKPILIKSLIRNGRKIEVTNLEPNFTTNAVEANKTALGKLFIMTFLLTTLKKDKENIFSPRQTKEEV